LISVELLDDEAFARYWIDQRESFRPRSHVALQHELREKGVSRAIIDQALLGLDELKSARQAAANKLYRWQKLPEEQFKLKLGRFLLRRGFSYEITNQLTSEMWRTVSADRAADPDATCEGD
jgi:regulatory protein